MQPPGRASSPLRKPASFSSAPRPLLEIKTRGSHGINGAPGLVLGRNNLSSLTC